MVAHLQAARGMSSGRCCDCGRGKSGTLGCDGDRQNTGRIPRSLGPHDGKARVTVGALSRTRLCAGRCHAGLAAGAQREPDWAKAEAEAGRALEAAAKDDQVAERVLAGVGSRLWIAGHPEAAVGVAVRRDVTVAVGNRAVLRVEVSVPATEHPGRASSTTPLGVNSLALIRSQPYYFINPLRFISASIS